MRVALVSSYVPRRCGLATFTADLRAALVRADPASEFLVAAIDGADPTERASGPAVRWRIRQGDPESYRAVGRAISATKVDVVNLQHEFGLYGTDRDGRYEDRTRSLMDEVGAPVVTTMHTVLPSPEPCRRALVRELAERSATVVVMAKAAAAVLRETYDLQTPPIVVPHGVPVVRPGDRSRSRERLGLAQRFVISTFGLVDPRKGLEYGIEAMPAVVARFPTALYLVIGQTHPSVVRAEGERYRHGLRERVARLGLEANVAFVDRYLTLPDVVSYLAATDVYVTPYLDPYQVTSGTLAYALGAGKAIVSTPYVHAREALADGRGLLVGFRDAAAIAAAVVAILADGDLRRRMERSARAYSVDAAWPVVARRLLRLMRTDVARAMAGAA